MPAVKLFPKMSDIKVNARKAAMRLLEYRDRTDSELRSKLADKGYEEAEIEDAMEYVISFGYVNDEKYTENFIYFNKERKSKARIKLDLIKKGICSDIIDRKFEEDPYEETGLIKKLIVKRIGNAGEADPEVLLKTRNYLFHKGFRYSDIEEALRELNLT